MEEPRVKCEGAGGAESYCRLCLSTERTLSCVRDVNWAYVVITGCEQTYDASCEQTMVCWECKAGLRRMLRLKQQALRARLLLEQAHVELTHMNISTQCLSQLKSSTKASYDYVLSYDTAAFWEPEPLDFKVSCLKSPAITLDMEILTDVDFATNLQMKEPSHGVTEADDELLRAVPKEEPELSDCDVWAEHADEIPITYDTAGSPDDLPLLTPVQPQLTPTTPEPKVKTKVKLKAKVKKKEKKRKATREVKQENLLEDICDRIRETYKSVLKKRESTLRNNKFLNRRYKCMTCAVSFHSHGGLRQHNTNLHCESAVAVTCEICSCRLPDAESLAAHAQTHELYKCRRCKFTTLSVKNMRRHHKAHERNQQRQSIPCDVCGKQFTNKQHFYVHYKTHTSKQIYECDHCGRVYKTRTQMFRHLRSHRKHFLCDICGKTFSDQTYLNCHYLAHADPSQRRFECPECHKRYINKFKLIVHMRFHTGEKPFKCQLCDKEFREKAQLTSHSKKVHAVTSSGTQLKKKRTFERTKSAFVNERYVEPKEKSQSESEDKQQSKDSKNVIKQETTERTRQKKDFVCNFCGMKFKDKWRLKFHLAVHSDERPYKCDECDLTFKYQSGLWTHKLLHKGEKHQCTVCGSLFTQKGNLTAHLKIHTDEKPFECNVCGNKFRMRRNLRNHFKIHSGIAVI